MPDPTNQQIAECVRVNYRMLLRFEAEFRASLSLLVTLTTRTNIDDARINEHMIWGDLARNSAALSVFHFGKCLHAIRSSAGRLPARYGAIDTSELKLASQRYESNFPHVDNVRHSIAHAGELNSTPQKAATHGTSSGSFFGYAFFDGAIVGSARLQIGLDGQRFDLDIGEPTAQRLSQIVSQVGLALPSSLKCVDPLSAG